MNDVSPLRGWNHWLDMPTWGLHPRLIHVALPGWDHAVPPGLRNGLRPMIDAVVMTDAVAMIVIVAVVMIDAVVMIVTMIVIVVMIAIVAMIVAVAINEPVPSPAGRSVPSPVGRHVIARGVSPRIRTSSRMCFQPRQGRHLPPTHTIRFVAAPGVAPAGAERISSRSLVRGLTPPANTCRPPGWEQAVPPGLRSGPRPMIGGLSK